MTLDTSRPRRIPITAPHARHRLALLLGALAVLLALTPAPGVAANQGAPTVTFVAVSSVPGVDGSYALGETIRVTLSFSEAVNVTGAPRLAIDMDPADWGRKWAAYESGSGTSNISFAHTVVEPNFSSQGIAVLADSLELNGGTIRSADSDADADLSHPGKAHDPQHKVDWQRSPTQANRAPVLNTGTQTYDWFVNEQNAPRGMLVSKSFAGLFTDPDGDQLTYTAAVTGGRAQLLDDLAIGSWGRSDVLAAQSPWPREATQRVFIEVDDEDDWDAFEPPLTARPVITVTVMATDPTGLSASVSGKFVIIWTAAVTGLNLDDDRANALGPQDSGSDEATGPTVTEVAITSDAGSNDTYELGETIEISLTFSEAVDVTGAPQLKIDMDPADWGTKVVPYASGSGTETLIFEHVVVEPNYSMQGIAVLENTLELNGGTIRSASSETGAALVHDGLTHDAEHRVSWLLSAEQPEAPTITEVTISSDAGSDRSYAKGETIRVALRLSETVSVTGAPRLKLDFRDGDGDEQWATYESGSGSTTLVLAYTVAEGDDSDDGVALLGNSLELNGGAIVSASDTANNALLTHTGLVRDTDHRVDCTEPTLLSAVAEGTTLTLTFDEALGAAASLTNAPFAVVRTPQGGSEVSIALTGAPVISSVSVTLTLASAVLETDTDVKVSYTKPTTGSANKLNDVAGNAVASFTDVSAMSDTTPPRLVRGQVDGDTLIMYFSEALDETSIGGWFRVKITLYSGNDHSFTANGSMVITGNKVTVGLGQSYFGTKYVAKAGVQNNLAYYIKDDSPGAKVLRDLAGNPVETPRFSNGRHQTEFIYPLENITVGPPRVTWVQPSSNPGADATYGPGDTISVRVTFNQPVLVVGEPRLKIAYDSGVGARLGDEKRAVYSSGSGTSELEFTYTVAEADNSTNMSTRGISVVRNSLTGGTIQSVQSGKEADRTHMGWGHDANHKVDIPLRLKSAELSGTTLTMHFNKPLASAPFLSSFAFVVTKSNAGGNAQRIQLNGWPQINGHTVTLKLFNPPPSSDDDVYVSYQKPSSGSLNRLADATGAELASFSNQSVGSDVTPPTLVRAEVNANMVTLVFNEPLDARHNQAHRFHLWLMIRSFFGDPSGGGEVVPVESSVEFSAQRDVQINGHRVTFTLGGGPTHTPRRGLDFEGRVYYYKLNEDTGPGLQDLAGNEVTIPHDNPGFWATRWVPLVNVTP
ncbi:MAG: hypothetical protein F4Y41_13865 [Gammaproteobacteria bacterium]|nr:hypothetical protein [Gammaproteobacteria bacterium]